MPRTGYKALLVANSTFPADAQTLPSLEGPINDITQLREVLVDREVGLFDAGEVRLVAERSTAEIALELEKFFASARKSDCLLFYYSGHGLLDQANHLFLCGRDSQTSYLHATALSSDRISAMIEGSAAGTTLIVLDCCHSGAFKGGSFADALAGSGRYLISSTRTRELAKDAIGPNRTSVFTTYLIRALREARDHDEDGLVDIDDLFEFVQARLAEESGQTPQRNFSGIGQIAIAARSAARSVSPSEPPPPVRRRAELELSESNIYIPALEAGETPSPERIEVFQRDGDPVAWSAAADADWIAVDVDSSGMTLTFSPAVGVNRGRVVVSGADGQQAILRIVVEVRPGPDRVSSEPSAKSLLPTSDDFPEGWSEEVFPSNPALDACDIAAPGEQSQAKSGTFSHPLVATQVMLNVLLYESDATAEASLATLKPTMECSARTMNAGLANTAEASFQNASVSGLRIAGLSRPSVAHRITMSVVPSFDGALPRSAYVDQVVVARRRHVIAVVGTSVDAPPDPTVLTFALGLVLAKLP